MAGSVTTALTNTFLNELMSGGHCLLPPVGPVTGTTAALVFTATSPPASTNGIAVGMTVTGTSVGAGAVVTPFNSNSNAIVNLSVSSTGATTPTFTGDVFKIALIASALAGNVAYGTLTTNAGVPGTGTPTQANLGTDEQAASGTYSAGGLAIVPAALVQTNPVNSSAAAFSTTIQWTGATLSTAGAIIYNTTSRLSGATSSAPPVNNRVVGVYSFGGTQSVTTGTLTLTSPTQDGHTGIIRLSPN